MRLQGKVALVTGAANERSIGWGIAHELAKEGAHIAVNDITGGDMLYQRVADLEALGVDALAVQADVTQPDQVDDMVRQVVARFGRLDIAASNAGVIRWEHFLDVTPRNLRAIVDVNVKGNANVCRAAARQMIAQGEGGRIVVTSSVQADVQFPHDVVYGSTKHAQHIFVGALALELARHNITVNHIGPGWVRTPLNDVAPGDHTEEALEHARREVPLRRDGWISEMGRAVVYFASEDGAYVTGTFLRVDGGLGISKYNL